MEERYYYYEGEMERFWYECLLLLGDLDECFFEGEWEECINGGSYVLSHCEGVTEGFFYLFGDLDEGLLLGSYELGDFDRDFDRDLDRDFDLDLDLDYERCFCFCVCCCCLWWWFIMNVPFSDY